MGPFSLGHLRIVILIIKKSPKTNVVIEIILNLSIDIKGMGIVSARYREIKEIFTKKRVLNFSIIF